MEFELAAFRAGDKKEKVKLLMSKAFCQKQQGEFNDALKSLNRALKHAGMGGQLRDSIIQERIFIHYTTADYRLSISDYYRLRHRPDLQQKQQYIYVLSRMKEDKDSAFFEAVKTFAANHNNDTLANWVIQQYQENKTISPRKASILSAIVPGLGATAAGKPIQGPAALLFTASFGYYGYYSFSNNMIGAGIFTGVLFPLRLYIGGLNYAANVAREKRLKKRNLIHGTIEKVILEIENDTANSM